MPDRLPLSSNARSAASQRVTETQPRRVEGLFLEHESSGIKFSLSRRSSFALSLPYSSIFSRSLPRRSRFQISEFLTFLDWCLHKEPFGTWPDYERIIDRETTHKFLTACYEQHSALGARDKLAAGQSNCTSFNFQSYVCADAVDLFLVIRMEGTS